MIARRQYAQVRDALAHLPHADAAEVIDALDPNDAAVAFRLLPRENAADVFAEFESDRQERLIALLGEDAALRVIEDMAGDDQARLFDELPVEIARPIIARLSPADRRRVQAILGYGPETVGRIMTPDYVRVRPEWTVARALQHIRAWGRDAETVHWVYVIDHDQKLIDDLHIRRILLAPEDATIESLMDHEFIALNATDDREEAVRVMNRYDRTAMPVVDGLGLLVGIVTSDDVADVAEIEATEDIHKLGGLEALSDPYMSTGVLAMFKKRGVWLALLFVLQLLTIGVMSRFEGQLETAVILAVFVPMILSSGGNTGSQASSLIVRAIALSEVSIADWWRIVRREVLVGLALGSVLGVMGVGVVLCLWAVGMVETPYPGRVGVTVGTAVVGIVLWGTLIGSMLPLVLEKLGLDPAASSSPLVATIMDVSGLTIYFLVALTLLQGTVL